MSAVMDSPAVRVMEFERRFRVAAAAGRPPDALRRYSPDEVERFWARTIPGLDGHVYWDGAIHFMKNGGRRRKPSYWVWEHTNGPIAPTYLVWAICGEKNCIASAHLACGPRDKHLYTDAQLLGSLQVAAMRLGHTPTTTWWKEHKMKPNEGTYVLRWGTWKAAVAAAGLPPTPVGRRGAHTRASCVAALRALATHTGRRPSRDDWDDNREWLRGQGFPTSHDTLRRIMGSWTDALKAAGFG